MRRMRHPVRSVRRPPIAAARTPVRGFTLIELLVVIVIIALLAALAVGALRRSPEDRINASARQLQSKILLSRNIAARDQRVSGIRLLQKSNDPWIVDGVELISSPGYEKGTLGGIQYLNGKWVIAGQFNRLAPPGLTRPNGTYWDFTTNATGRGLIRPGSRIEIPAGSGRWYSVRIPEDLNLNGVLDPGEDLDGDSNLDYTPDRLILDGHYSPSTWDSGSNTYIAQPATNIPYRLELAPTVTAGEEPLRFQPGVAIDLAACVNVPQSREILFAPGQGLTGENAAGGNIYLYFATLEDIELTRNLPMAPGHPALASPGTFVPTTAPTVPANVSSDPNTPGVPKTEPVAIAVFGQTGNVISVPVDLTPVSAPANLRAFDPYINARRGKELNR